MTIEEKNIKRDVHPREQVDSIRWTKKNELLDFKRIKVPAQVQENLENPGSRNEDIQVECTR